MPKEYTDISSIVNGCVRYHDLGYTIMQLDVDIEGNIKETSYYQWDGTLSAKEQLGFIKKQPGLCAGVAIAPKPIEQMMAVGEYGNVFAFGNGEDHEERLGTENDGPRNRGPLRCVREIDGKVYACGMQRQVYRRDDREKWVDIASEIRPQKKGEVVGFEGIDGYSAKDIYAAGWDGEIWHYNGTKWSQIASPTNDILTAVCCAGDGFVYACGRRGLLIRGRDDKWEVLSKPGSVPADLWSLCWFQDRLYASSGRYVFSYDKESGYGVMEMGTEDDPVNTAYRLSARDGVMWSLGAKDVMSYDGKKWTRIE